MWSEIKYARLLTVSSREPLKDWWLLRVLQESCIHYWLHAYLPHHGVSTWGGEVLLCVRLHRFCGSFCQKSCDTIRLRQFWVRLHEKGTHIIEWFKLHIFFIIYCYSIINNLLNCIFYCKLSKFRINQSFPWNNIIILIIIFTYFL